MLRAQTGGANRFAEFVEECHGLDALEELQRHDNEKIYEKAARVLRTYFDGFVRGLARVVFRAPKWGTLFVAVRRKRRPSSRRNSRVRSLPSSPRSPKAASSSESGADAPPSFFESSCLALFSHALCHPGLCTRVVYIVDS